jgi:hypothetical protein
MDCNRLQFEGLQLACSAQPARWHGENSVVVGNPEKSVDVARIESEESFLGSRRTNPTASCEESGDDDAFIEPGDHALGPVCSPRRTNPRHAAKSFPTLRPVPNRAIARFARACNPRKTTDN